ncbi:ABC transporter ATP-binding protein [Aureimonas ureilytica]|nr:ABC transporter ATP-binding protein [Aureimonas ureilytica]
MTLHMRPVAPADTPAPDIHAGRSALTFRDLSFEAGGREILRDVSIQAEAGKVLCLLGPSGSGKTSLLRMAAGIERQTRGEIWIGDRLVAGPERYEPPEARGVGLVFQDFALFPHKTLRDNVLYGLAGLPRREAKARAEAALDHVRLGPLADSFPHHLSGGEQQRAALARALAPRPRVILMDEPFSGLDSRLKDEVRAETLAILTQTRSTAVIVTHDPEEAMRMGDRIALLRNGRLVQTGTPRQLYLNPSSLFAAGFLAEINVLAGSVQAGKVTTPLGIVAHSPRSDGTKMDVAVRLTGVKLATSTGGTSARVLERRFLGGEELVLLAVDGVSAPVRARFHPGELADNVHDVFVAVDPVETFVFERTEGSV